MDRRQFVSHLAGAAGALSLPGLPAASAQTTPPVDPTVKRVLVLFKCHLDVGFIDTQAAVIRKYFTTHYPRAIEIAEQFQQDPSGARYVWTTGSWMLYQYLEQAKAPERRRMEHAIAAGHVAWHALPFTWQTELLDPAFITGALGFSKTLDRRFGRKTTGAKMTDVPGHCRGLIRPLAESGVTFLDVGVNSASTPPDVPPVFLWKDPGGASIILMYHRLAYGGVVRIPNSGLAIAVEMADDNYGPHKPEEITASYAALRRQFPNAEVRAANLAEIAGAVEPHKAALPVLTQEIGDTWIHGVASDPVKLARFREVLRARAGWIAGERFKPGDSTDLAFLSQFALAAEHTWGTDTKTWLDFDHYTPGSLASMLGQVKYRTVTNSWVEKRTDIDQGIAALPPDLRAEARRRVAALAPVRPFTGTLRPFDATKLLETAHFTIGLDPATGAVTRLKTRAGNREWASTRHPLGVFSYQTLSKQDFDRFLATYITVQTDWAPKDFGKPGMEKSGAVSRIWKTKLVNAFQDENPGAHRLVLRLQMDGGPQSPSGITAWPEEVWLTLEFPKDAAHVNLDLCWFGKRANRLPEALWFSFRPDAPEAAGWQLHKTGGPVSPFDVVPGGNRHMHAVSTGLSYRDAGGALGIDTLDAPLVALGRQSPLFFTKEQPDLSGGFHFNLFNNAWGTNYVQWFGEDMRFRFSLRA